MNIILMGLAIYGHVDVTPPVIEDSISNLESSISPKASHIQYCWGCYRSPYRYYYAPPSYRFREWGIPQRGYWGPRWQRDLYWNYNRWRQGW